MDRTFINRAFWSDPDIEEQPHEIKLCALWLMTNPRLTHYGYSETTEKRFAFETGLPPDTLARTLQALPRAFVPVGKGVWVRNFIRYQIGGTNTLVINNIGKAIVRDLESRGNPELSALVYTQYPNLLTLRELSLARGSEAPCKGQEKRREEKRREEKRREEKKGSAEGKQPGLPIEEDIPPLPWESDAGKKTLAWLAELFPRSDGRPLDREEIEPFASLNPTDDDKRVITWFYQLPDDPKERELQCRRKSRRALIANFAEELDRAYGYAKKTGGPDSPMQKKTTPEPDGWQERAREKFGPDVELPDRFHELPPSLRCDDFIAGKAVAA
jgi:TfoX/Sxy family transcriptional regulator of competence genes